MWAYIKEGDDSANDGASKNVAPVVHVVRDARQGRVVGQEECYGLQHRPHQPVTPPRELVLYVHLQGSQYI